MSTDGSTHLPSRVASNHVELSIQPEGLLVGGDPQAVEAYLSRLRLAAGKSMRVVGIDNASATSAAALAVGAATTMVDSGKFVQLHPDSINALRVGNWIPGTDGFFRMTTRSVDGTFLNQLQWAPAQIAPPQMMALQLIATQVALKTAIAQVEEAVERVEGKVESVLQLAEASRAGDVLGHHLSVHRAVEFLDKHGVVTDADWDTLASLGPTLNTTVEQLRNYVGRLLKSFDLQLPVQDRAAKLRRAVSDDRLAEALSLLVVAEQSLYQWQRLRIARVEATQPEHLQRVIDDVRDLLAHQLSEDGTLYRTAKELLDHFAKPEAIEGFRFFSVRELAKQRSALQCELDRFAEARRHQIEEWESVDTPSVLDAAAAALDAASDSAKRAIGAAGQGLIRIGEFLSEKGQPARISNAKKGISKADDRQDSN